MIYKWAFGLVALMVQTWLSVDFFSRNSFGFVLDSLVFFVGMAAVMVVVGFVGYWLCWYVGEVVRCQRGRVDVSDVGGLWAMIRKLGSCGWEIGLSRLRGAKSTLVGIITAVTR